MKSKKEEVFTTILVLVSALLVLFVIFSSVWLIYAALLLSIASLFSSVLASAVHAGWMKFAHLLNLVVPKILLGALFFLILTPVSMMAKLFRKSDPLMLSANRKTTYLSVDKVFDKEHFEQPW